MKNVLVIPLWLISLLTVHAQPGALDLSFDPGEGVSTQTIATIAIQSDGQIIIGGGFDIYNLIPIRSLARLNTDASLDTTFQTGTGFIAGRNGGIIVNGEVFSIAIQNDGKIVVGGAFNEFDGIAAGSICRLNPDGSLDTTFHYGTGFSGEVLAIKIQPDGKILAGGVFTNYNGTAVNNIIRLNTDGTIDTSFHPHGGPAASIEAIDLYPDNRIAVGGDFTQYDSVYIFRVARLHTDGTLDTTFKPLLGAHAVVYDLQVLPNNSLAICGTFSLVSFQPRGSFAILDGNGDLVFSSGTGATGWAFDVQYLSNGNILVAGDFTAFNGSPLNRIVPVSYFGVVDTTFDPGSGPDKGIGAIALQADGKIMIAGAFYNYNGVARAKLARLYNCLSAQPDSIYGPDHALCSGSQQTYYVDSVPGASKYEWTLPSGWTGTSDSASIIATSDGSGGVISVKAFTDSCGYSYATTRTIATIQPPPVNICLVTVDDSSTHNIIIWEKPFTNTIDSFFIYRETTTNIYSKIASIPYDSLSAYHDYDANPNATSYRYKISVADTCGAESALSPYHNSIHLQSLGSGNFQWTFYQIENAPNPVISFNVNRDNLGDGNFFPIGLVPGTNATFTDLNYFAFPNAEYVVDVNWNISCTPTRGVNTTRSNIRRGNSIAVGMEENSEAGLEIYPNPAENMIYIRSSFPQSIKSLRLINMLGKIVRSGPFIHAIDVSAFSKGIYLLEAETENTVIKKKIIIQ